MSPEYIEDLADWADPDRLWRLPVFEQLDLPIDKQMRLDAGVALRRHAHTVRELRALVGTGKSLLITQLSVNGSAVKTVPTPPDHRRLQGEST